MTAVRMVRNDTIERAFCGAAGVALLLLVPAARAQDAPQTVQSLDNFTLQPSRPTPTPVAPVIVLPTLDPTIDATPTPRATPSARTTPRATPRAPIAAPTPAVTPTPVPAPVQSASTALPTPARTPVAPPPVVQPAPVAQRGLPFWLISTALLGIGVLVGIVVLRRRRREPIEQVAVVSPLPLPVPPPPEPVPAAPRFLEPVAPIAPVQRAWIDLSLSARRAGVNLVTATADVEVTMHNKGDGVARNVRLDVRLLSARNGQDDELGAVFAAPVGRPVTALFDLAPEETRTIRTLVTMPRDAITVLTAADRPMFVPVVAVNAVYGLGGGAKAQTAAAYAIGVARGGAAKLAPFWLDGPTRMYDALAVRPHALALRN